jgi:hypothetical protein
VNPGRLSVLALLAFLAGFSSNFPAAGDELKFQITLRPGLAPETSSGRLFVILAHTNQREPRLTIGHTVPNAPVVLARDLPMLSPDQAVTLDQTAYTFPISNLSALPAGEYFVQALFDWNRDVRSPAAPGNLFSTPKKLRLSPDTGMVKLELSERVPEESQAESAQIKFVKIQSKLLSDFHHRPIYLRAGIVLPRDYEKESSRHYPLWIRIGGLNSRYTSVSKMMAGQSDFKSTWLSNDTPRFILLQLDGTGPFGDPYYVNSANSGPFGDALVQELIPYVETKFRAIAQPRARVLSGSSTGGWVTLALQILYPDFFNGAWAACPDPVDFRALELVNIYQDENAFVNKYGNERPSDRTAQGDIVQTVREEVATENLLGRSNCYTSSGKQWGEWTAAFSPRGADGLPVPLFDPITGKIDHAAATEWRKYDLRMILEKNWKNLAPKLRGKLHITAGEADRFFLNNAVHLLDEFLAKADPPFEGSIIYGPGKGHGWSNLSLRQMLDQMKAAADP